FSCLEYRFGDARQQRSWRALDHHVAMLHQMIYVGVNRRCGKVVGAARLVDITNAEGAQLQAGDAGIDLFRDRLAYRSEAGDANTQGRGYSTHSVSLWLDVGKYRPNCDDSPFAPTRGICVAGCLLA